MTGSILLLLCAGVAGLAWWATAWRVVRVDIEDVAGRHKAYAVVSRRFPPARAAVHRWSTSKRWAWRWSDADWLLWSAPLWLRCRLDRRVALMVAQQSEERKGDAKRARQMLLEEPAAQGGEVSVVESEGRLSVVRGGEG